MKTDRELYIVDPRFEDGTLNVKDHECFALWKTNGVSEKELFDYYFKNHPEKDTASWDELKAYFREKGWYIRLKYW